MLRNSLSEEAGVYQYSDNIDLALKDEILLSVPYTLQICIASFDVSLDRRYSSLELMILTDIDVGGDIVDSGGWTMSKNFMKICVIFK